MKPERLSARQPDFDWHTLAVDTAMARLQTSILGLSNAEAERRRKVFGDNVLETARRMPAWRVLLNQFANALILILLAATAISAFLGHTTEAVAIAVIVLFSVLLGFIQEFRAERSMEALRHLAAPMATAWRDGEETELPARELVPGDLILLQTGDRIPADARLLDAVNLHAEESALTGESLPVEKHTQPLPHRDLPLGDRRNMVYGGTLVTQGRGRAVVAATGLASEFGQIVRLLQNAEPQRTPLQKNLDKAGRGLAWGALVLVAIILGLGVYRGEPWLEMLVFSIALAVAVVPEALPAVVTISLSLGAQRMSRRNALIRQLPAVETLGSTSVICSDKTGTLTRDEMTARQIFCAGTFWEVGGAGYAPSGEFRLAGAAAAPSGVLRQLLESAALASDADILFSEEEQRWRLKGDPTEGALVVAAAKAGLAKPDLDSHYPRVGELPFTSETKRMTTLHAAPDGVFACVKGAPEMLLPDCARILTDEGEEVLDEEGRARMLDAARQMASQALRVLAVARRTGATLKNAATDLTLLGLVGMIDPPRPEAGKAIATCQRAGIRVVMITGDHPATARAVARELGLLEEGGAVVSGAELQAMSDAELENRVDSIRVYARVSPADKLRVVEALQKKGHVTAMTGDGVNDAPALKKADIGVAMGQTGTDVSREAAAMMLTDDNFASIVAAVEEGRAIFGNIKKYLMYLLSSNLGEIGLMVGASVLGLPLPLSAVQILYVNLASDGLPALALAFDPPDSDLMQRRPRNPESGVFSRPVVLLITIGGLWSTAINLGLFLWLLHEGRPLAEAMTLTFLSLLLIQFFKAYNFRSDRRSLLFRPFANRWLNLAVLWELSLLPFLIHYPPLQPVFGTAPIAPQDWLLTAAVSATICPVLEAGKWMVRRGWLGRER
jgi:Ca2+-transporting ATPase